MKVLKNALTLFALIAVFSTAALAQVTVNASATVQAALSVTTLNNLEFGNIIAGDTPTIAATDAGAGTVSIANAANTAGLDVSVTFPSTLTNGDATTTDDLTFTTYTAAYRLDGTEDNSGSTTSLGTPIGQVISGQFNSLGNTIYLYVGGQITNTGSGVAGDQYANDITVDVSYQ